MLRILPLVDWNNGIVMIGAFALVVIGLVAALFMLMNGGKGKDSSS